MLAALADSTRGAGGGRRGRQDSYATASSSSASSSRASSPRADDDEITSSPSSLAYALAASTTNTTPGNRPSSQEMSPWAYSPACHLDEDGGCHTSSSTSSSSSSTTKVSLSIAERIAGYLSLKDLITYLSLDKKAQSIYEVGR